MKASDLIPADQLDEEYLVETEEDPRLLEFDMADPIKVFTKIHALAAYMFAHGSTLAVISNVTGMFVTELTTFVKESHQFNSVVKDFKDNPEHMPRYNPVATANTILSEALDELLRRLANEPDSFTHKELMFLVQMLSDRTDLGLNPKAPAGADAPADVAKIKEQANVETRKGSHLPALEEALARARDISGVDKPQGRVELFGPEDE